MMETFSVLSKTDKEIVFKSIEDLKGFFEAVSNGSWVMIEFKDGKKTKGEVISPDISAVIRDKKMIIRSEEEGK
mgnify:CR=1 FL=1